MQYKNTLINWQDNVLPILSWSDFPIYVQNAHQCYKSCIQPHYKKSAKRCVSPFTLEQLWISDLPYEQEDSLWIFFANLWHIFKLYKMQTNSFWQPVAVNLSTSGAHLMDIGQKLHRSGSGADLRGIHQRAQQAAASRSPAASRRSFSLRWVLRFNRLPNIPCPIRYLQWLIFHKLVGNM